MYLIRVPNLRLTEEGVALCLTPSPGRRRSCLASANLRATMALLRDWRVWEAIHDGGGRDRVKGVRGRGCGNDDEGKRKVASIHADAILDVGEMEHKDVVEILADHILKSSPMAVRHKLPPSSCQTDSDRLP